MEVTGSTDTSAAMVSPKAKGKSAAASTTLLTIPSPEDRDNKDTPAADPMLPSSCDKQHLATIQQNLARNLLLRDTRDRTHQADANFMNRAMSF